MRRKVLIVLLSLGTIGGYGAGFASMHGRSNCHRATFEQHVADVCVRAAEDARVEGRREGRRPPPDRDRDRDHDDD